MRWLALAGLVIVLDQASKLAIDHLFTYGQRVNVLPVFDLILVYNHGAAFSFLASEPGWQRWLFTLLGLVAAAVIVWLLRRQARTAEAGRARLSMTVSSCTQTTASAPMPAANTHPPCQMIRTANATAGIATNTRLMTSDTAQRPPNRRTRAS